MITRLTKMFVLGLLALSLTGCAAMWGGFFGDSSYRQGSSSSLVDFLYPNGEVPPPADGVVPELRLPLRVGLAFVPSRSGVTGGLTESHKQQLLDKVRAAFAGRDYIQDIQIIPDTYLRSRGGFTNLEQVARLHGLDVIALVSYDQVGFIGENKGALTYWTIVGAYLIKGTEHDIQTFVDTAVFDVASHKLLLRAPGTDTHHGTATLAESSVLFRKAREEGFDRAVTGMIGNLDAELTAFREKLRKDKSVAKVSYRPGYSGGGAFDGLALLLLAMGVAARYVRRTG